MTKPADRLEQWLGDPRRKTWVMGILNATPDSFSDGGQWTTLDAAIAHAGQMLVDGADILDLGGESTRPGSSPISDAEQIDRVTPLIQQIVQAFPQAIVSIDTTRSAVAKSAIDAGAAMVNDISAGRDDPAMLPLVASRQVPIVLMHMKGTPATMQLDPTYNDVTAEVRAFLIERLAAATSAGIKPNQIILDPGIGFGKTTDHNLQLLRDLPNLVNIGRPLMVGASRKGFIGKITSEVDAASRQFGTAAITAWAVGHGALLLRVHDVAETVRTVRMIEAIITRPASRP